MKASRKKYIIGLCLLLIVLIVVWHQKQTIQFLPTDSQIEQESDKRSTMIQNQITPKHVEPKDRSKRKESPHAVQSREVLVAGGLSIPVVFEEESQEPLSKEQRFEIIQDIQLIYGHLDQFEIYATDRRKVRVAGTDLTIEKKIQFVGSGRYFPPAHRDPFGLISGDPDHYEIVIPSELIAAYRQALDFISKHEQAFERLKLFLPESNNYSDAWSTLEASDVVWTPASLNMSSETKERIFRQIKNAKIRRPSILDFITSKKGDARSGLPELPEGTIVGKALLLDGDNFPQNYEAVVYVGEKWHFAVVPPGT